MPRQFGQAELRMQERPIPYGKLLQDAKLRQGIFFQKLGLTNLDPTAVAEGEALDKVAAPEMSEEIGA